MSNQKRCENYALNAPNFRGGEEKGERRPTYKRREGRKGGLLLRETKGTREGTEGRGRQSPKVKVSRINTV